MTRKYLTSREWRDLFKEQGEKCALCPDTLGPFEADHGNPNYFDNAKPDQIICVPCHKAKTRRDKLAIYHVKRLNGEVSSQHDRRLERKAKGFRSPLTSRPFASAKRQARSRDDILGAR